ncbi:MAG: FAD-dependent oxidoreductase [Chloroflexi bacterium]|nr:FAD-dependent oxidoreductase [Chloroflexota bacterium]
MADLDLAIVGGGVAGLTAGLYAARERLSVSMYDRMGPGGQLNTAGRIENFPGFPGGVNAYELGPRIAEQAMEAGCGVQFGEVQAIALDVTGGGPEYLLQTDAGEVTARAVIIATGSRLARLGIDGEERLEGRGVSYCATCDGEFFRDQDVVVAGGGDSAIDEALHLADTVRSITVVTRGEALRGSRATAERLRALPNVRVLPGHLVTALHGDAALEAVTVQPVDANSAADRIEARGLFVYVGLLPNTSLVSALITLDAAGHIPVDLEMATERAGLFAAGDIRQRSARQLVSAAGDGATAAIAAVRYLRGR